MKRILTFLRWLVFATLVRSNVLATQLNNTTYTNIHTQPTTTSLTITVNKNHAISLLELPGTTISTGTIARTVPVHIEIIKYTTTMTIIGTHRNTGTGMIIYNTHTLPPWWDYTLDWFDYCRSLGVVNIFLEFMFGPIHINSMNALGRRDKKGCFWNYGRCWLCSAVFAGASYIIIIIISKSSVCGGSFSSCWCGM